MAFKPSSRASRAVELQEPSLSPFWFDLHLVPNSTLNYNHFDLKQTKHNGSKAILYTVNVVSFNHDSKVCIKAGQTIFTSKISRLPNPIQAMRRFAGPKFTRFSSSSGKSGGSRGTARRRSSTMGRGGGSGRGNFARSPSMRSRIGRYQVHPRVVATAPTHACLYPPPRKRPVPC